MGLSKQRSAIAVLVEDRCHGAIVLVGRQVHSDRGHAMRARISSGQDGRSRGLAVRVLASRPGESGPLRRKAVQVGSVADRVAVNAEAVCSLLVGCDEKNVQARVVGILLRLMDPLRHA